VQKSKWSRISVTWEPYRTMETVTESAAQDSGKHRVSSPADEYLEEQGYKSDDKSQDYMNRSFCQRYCIAQTFGHCLSHR